MRFIASKVGDPPSQKQAEILEFMRWHIREYGCSPSIREIGDHFSIKSPNGVMCHLKALVKKGLLKQHGRGMGLSRSFVLLAADGLCPSCGQHLPASE